MIGNELTDIITDYNSVHTRHFQVPNSTTRGKHPL